MTLTSWYLLCAVIVQFVAFCAMLIFNAHKTRELIAGNDFITNVVIELRNVISEADVDVNAVLARLRLRRALMKGFSKDAQLDELRRRLVALESRQPSGNDEEKGLKYPPADCVTYKVSGPATAPPNAPVTSHIPPEMCVDDSQQSPLS